MANVWGRFCFTFCCTAMPAMSILSLTLNFCPISLSLGTQYSTMLLNYTGDTERPHCYCRKSSKSMIFFFLNNCDLSPGRGIGLVLFHFWPTSSWYVPLWWVRWLGWQCLPLPRAFHKPPAVCASSPRIEQIRQKKTLDWRAENNETATVFKNGKTQKYFVIVTHQMAQILMKSWWQGQMEEQIYIKKQTTVTNSSYKTRSRKPQLPFCSNSTFAPSQTLAATQHDSISNSLIGQCWSLLRNVRQRSEQRRRETWGSYHFPDCCVGMVCCSGDQLQCLCNTQRHTHGCKHHTHHTKNIHKSE